MKPPRYEAIPASRALAVIVVIWLVLLVVVFAIWPPWRIPDQSGPTRPAATNSREARLPHG